VPPGEIFLSDLPAHTGGTAQTKSTSSKPKRLPSLRALLAFEATARNLSISRAAKELNLTASAVSHSIAVLEAQLHKKLFQRFRNGVVLTGSGRQLLGTAQAALSIMESAFATPASGPRHLAISVLPSFATRWLMPRLPRLLSYAPDIRFEIQSVQALTEFDVEQSADVGIRFGSGDWPLLDTLKLTDERVVPVASPAYRDGRLPMAPEELVECKLIVNPRTPWSLWANQFGLRLNEKDAVISIDDSSMVFQAAIAGVGIALARVVLVADELASGRLVPLFHSTEIAARGYWLAWPKNSRKRALIDQLAAWLSEEMSSTVPRE
jgi:LysR family transcriptional regulator, glycine cleavage system transcriptional activator